MSEHLYAWYKQATKDEREKLAYGAKTNIAYLKQLALGNRKITASKAVLLSNTSISISRLPPLDKEKLVFGETRKPVNVE